MLSLENRQYGGGYQACKLCGIQTRESNLLNGLCSRCTPMTYCEICGDAENVQNGNCVDRATCSERVWRVEEKAKLVRLDQLRRAKLNSSLASLTSLGPHHNESCDYRGGNWCCEEPCPASNPDLTTIACDECDHSSGRYFDVSHSCTRECLKCNGTGRLDARR